MEPKTEAQELLEDVEAAFSLNAFSRETDISIRTLHNWKNGGLVRPANLRLARSSFVEMCRKRSDQMQGYIKKYNDILSTPATGDDLG